MALSANIRLPKTVTPVFPKRCVYSGGAAPDSEVVVVTTSQSAILSFLAALFPLPPGLRRVRAPICRRYRSRFYLQTFGRDILMIAVIILMVFVLVRNLGAGAAFPMFQLCALVFGTIFLWSLFEVFFPRRFDITARGKWIDYQFASAEYAAEFAQLNRSHVIQQSPLR